MKQLSFGRAQDCDIIFDDKSVSRHHGHLSVFDNKVYIVDDGSTYGTFVNGQKITDKTVVSRQDKVTLSGKIPFNWQEYVFSDGGKTMLTTDATILTSRPRSKETANAQTPQRPLVDIPSKIEINQNYNYAEVYRNGSQGADWKVPLKRNMGDKIGNAVGSTLGCIISIAIVVAVIAIVVSLAH